MDLIALFNDSVVGSCKSFRRVAMLLLCIEFCQMHDDK